jgi:tripartite-type tricarboxylate transporter receptor subunit TctC
MKLPRRNFLHLTAGAAALPAASLLAWAQTYPARPVRIVVGFAPGGGTDIMARLIGQWLSERLGQQFVVENRPGAGTNIATEAVVNAPPDGYTLLLACLPNASNATLYENLKFNFIRDITPVAGIDRQPFAIEVNPSVPVKTVPEFITHAKAYPGKINMASGGIGSGNADCCPRAIRGHAAAPPSPAMNSRRFISHPRADDLSSQSEAYADGHSRARPD